MDINHSPEIIKLPAIKDCRGGLSFIEENNQIPFKISRVYWIFEVTNKTKYGDYPCNGQQELILALSGSFNVLLADGSTELYYHLDRSDTGLYIPAGICWYLENFSSSSVALVLCDTACDEQK